MGKQRSKRSRQSTPTRPKTASSETPAFESAGDRRARVLYDGECAMCSNLALRINAGDARNSLDTRNLHEATLPDGVSEAAVRRELHVIDEDGAVTRGADAVFRILEEYPRWRLLARLGRSPLLRPFARIGYRYVAANRDHIFGPGARLFWSKNVVLLGLLAGMALSPKLWLPERAYPMAPLLPELPIPRVAGLIALGVVITAAIGAWLAPKPRAALIAALGGAIVLAAADQTRWQPWFYQYAIMLGVLAAWSRRPREPQVSLEALAALRTIVVGIYLWSGIQKLNASYFAGTFGWLLQPLEGIAPTAFVAMLSRLGPATPALEIAIGLGLLFARTRPIAVASAVAMHTLILAMLGPWAHNWNSVVWPWNAAMIALVLVLFAKDGTSGRADILRRPASAGHAVAIAAFVVLPALSLVDRWDPYLSSSLYSRNLRHAAIRLRADMPAHLPAAWQPYIDEEDVLWPMTWALEALNVPAYPAPRVYKALARAVCRELPDPDGAILGLSTKPDIFTGELTVTDYGCAEL